MSAGSDSTSARSYRIVVIGEQWFGATGAAVAAGLRRLGHDVTTVDRLQSIPRGQTFAGRVLGRVARGIYVREFNHHVLTAARLAQPEIVVALKGARLWPETLRALQRGGARCYNYYPDVSVSVHDRYIPKTLPLYDQVFTTKRYHLEDLAPSVGSERLTFLPHGYSPDVHRPYAIDQCDAERFGADIGFVGSFSEHKARSLAVLARHLPELRLRIWGNRWDKSRYPELESAITGQPLLGASYAKGVCASKVNVAIHHGLEPGLSRADSVSTRSFEIPACGGFMIHERNDEILQYFAEDREAVFFSSDEELVEKVRHYATANEERRAIAKAGFERCVPDYSYDERMRDLLEWHRTHFDAT